MSYLVQVYVQDREEKNGDKGWHDIGVPVKTIGEARKILSGIKRPWTNRRIVDTDKLQELED